MAKSPVGGSRAMLKGRIGSDVYSVGKDGKGRRQQVVRSLAEQVSNPRTTSQMANRMVMSTVMQAAKYFHDIIDHSFDGTPIGQPSISKFISLNYAVLAKGTGVYNEYQEKGVKKNPYVLSRGTLQYNEKIFFGQCTNDDSTAFGKWGICIQTGDKQITVGELRAIIGGGAEDGYVTCINLEDYGGKTAGYVRYRVNPELADNQNIFDENYDPIENLFVTEGNGGYVDCIVDSAANQGRVAQIFLSTGNANQKDYCGAIWSKKINGSWKHSSCQLGEGEAASNYDTALATYPVGSEQFLNGGDL